MSSSTSQKIVTIIKRSCVGLKIVDPAPVNESHLLELISQNGVYSKLPGLRGSSDLEKAQHLQSYTIK